MLFRSDDMSRVPALHPWEGELHPVEDAVDVDVDHSASGQVVLVDEPAQRHDPGVVDQHVERAEPLLDLVEEALERVASGDVELERQRPVAERRSGALGELAVEVADRDLRSLGDERTGGRFADPPGGVSLMPAEELPTNAPRPCLPMTFSSPWNRCRPRLLWIWIP